MISHAPKSDLNRIRLITSIPVVERSQRYLQFYLGKEYGGKEIHGWLELDGRHPVCIHVYKQLSNIKKICVIAHELGHWRCYKSGCHCVNFSRKHCKASSKEFKIAEAHADFNAVLLLNANDFDQYSEFLQAEYGDVWGKRNNRFHTMVRKWKIAHNKLYSV